MMHALLVQHLTQSPTNNRNIEPERPPLQVFKIELNLVGDRQFIAAVHLRPTGQSRYKKMNAPLSSKRDEIILIEQRRARSNKTQVTHQDAPQLRQFVEARAAKEAAYG